MFFFFAISLLSPLENGYGPLIEQTWVPFTQRCFVLSLVEIAFDSGCGEEGVYVKSLQTDGRRPIGD